MATDRLAIVTVLERSAGLTVPDPALANAVTVGHLVAAATMATPLATPLATAQAAATGIDTSIAGSRELDATGETDSETDVEARPAGHGWVDPGGHVGAGTRLWHQAQVGEGARVGADRTLGEGAFVGPGSVIGTRVKIGNYAGVFGAVIGDEAMVSPGALLLEDPAPRATTPDGLRKGPADFRRGAVVAPGVVVGDHAMR